MQDLKKLGLSAIHLKDVVLTDKISDKIRELIVLIIEEDMSNFISHLVNVMNYAKVIGEM